MFIVRMFSSASKMDSWQLFRFRSLSITLFSDLVWIRWGYWKPDSQQGENDRSDRLQNYADYLPKWIDDQLASRFRWFGRLKKWKACFRDPICWKHREKVRPEKYEYRHCCNLPVIWNRKKFVEWNRVFRFQYDKSKPFRSILRCNRQISWSGEKWNAAVRCPELQPYSTF